MCMDDSFVFDLRNYEAMERIKHFAATQRIEWMFQFKCDFLDFNSITIEVAEAAAVASKLKYPNKDVWFIQITNTICQF